MRGVKDDLMSEFDMFGLGPASHNIGIEIQRDLEKGPVSLSQKIKCYYSTTSKLDS